MKRRAASTPLPLPAPSTTILCGAHTRASSAAWRSDSLLQTTRCASAHDSRSVATSSARRAPVAAVSGSPRMWYTRTGTPAMAAAVVPSSPPLGVCACTTCGRSRRSVRTSAASAARSRSGVMRRGISTVCTSMPSWAAKRSRSAPGLEIAATEKPRARM